MPGSERVEYLINNYHSQYIELTILNAWFACHLIFYFSISLKKFVTFRKKLAPDRVEKYDASTGWFRIYLILLLTLLVISLPISIIINDDNTNIILVQIVMNIQFVYIFIKILWSSHLFPVDTVLSNWGKDKYARSSLSGVQIDNFYIRALNYLKAENIFTHHDISIGWLAAKIDIPIHYLSQAINTKNGSNFFDFINKLRIEEAQKLLFSNDFNNYTIEAIAYESGFGTKVSFNKAFKKFTGKTPSEFCKGKRE